MDQGAAVSGHSLSSKLDAEFTQTFSSVDPLDLVLWYGFEESNGSVVRDLSGNQNDGTLVGGSRVPGKFGNSLSMNESDYLIADGDKLSLYDFTISLWAKVLDDSEGVLLRNGQFSCLLYTSPSPRDATLSRMPSSA